MLSKTTGILSATNAYVHAPCADYETAAINLSGTWTGNVEFYATIDEVNYPFIGVTDPQDGTIKLVLANAATATTVVYFANIAGLTAIGCSTDSWISGTCNVQINVHRVSK